jgi:hypothetical protein
MDIDEIYTRKVTEDFNNLRHTVTYYNEDDEIHRLYNPAIITYDKSGKEVCMEWRMNGKLHRVDGPAKLEFKPWKEYQDALYAWWYRNDQHHIGPGEHADANYCVVVNDVRVEESWRSNRYAGNRYESSEIVYHNSHGPARRFRNPENNRIIEQQYHDKGKLHRKDGPAIIKYDPDTGDKLEENYYWRGKRHREDGPAIIRYDAKTGDIIEQEFFINGKSTKSDNAPSSP